MGGCFLGGRWSGWRVQQRGFCHFDFGGFFVDHGRVDHGRVSMKRGDGSKEWDFGETALQIDDAINDFSHRLDEETFSWFEEAGSVIRMESWYGLSTSS